MQLRGQVQFSRVHEVDSPLSLGMQIQPLTSPPPVVDYFLFFLFFFFFFCPTRRAVFKSSRAWGCRTWLEYITRELGLRSSSS
jgi:hypothetical protein